LPARTNLLPVSVLDVMKIVGNTPTTVTCEAKGQRLLLWREDEDVIDAVIPQLKPGLAER
jgi:hypothetical protein